MARADRLVWDASTGTVDGYRVHYGTESGVYIGSVDVGDVLEYPLIQQNFPDWVRGETYYLVVTAYNEAGESDYSNEVSWEVPPPPEEPPKPIPTLEKPQLELTPDEEGQ